jgi:predicted nucleic acid-binding protein
MHWLVDTNVVSEFARPRPDAGVVKWARGIERVSISAVTVEEIAFGMSWKPDERIRTWLSRFLAEACDVISVSQAIAEEAGVMRGTFRTAGITRTQADMLIAATASVHGLTLVTRNVRDFAACRIKVFNPFV